MENKKINFFGIGIIVIIAFTMILLMIDFIVGIMTWVETVTLLNTLAIFWMLVINILEDKKEEDDTNESS
jgi:hypothetical protein